MQIAWTDPAESSQPPKIAPLAVSVLAIIAQLKVLKLLIK